ncbi:MAG: flagellar motor protein MotB [Burkholderiaceae bacterium]
MLFAQRQARRAPRDEAEKPFWISFADLMTALMVLFLVVMGVALLAITKNVTDREQQQEQRRKDIEAVFDQLGKTAARHEGVRIDRDRHVIDFGDRARFAFNKSTLAAEQEIVLRQFVPELIGLADSPLGRKVMKRIVVEGYADRTGSYLSNLNLQPAAQPARALRDVRDTRRQPAGRSAESQRARPVPGGWLLVQCVEGQ